jgi:hypothetical protein
MTTVAANLPAPAAEEERHRLTAAWCWDRIIRKGTDNVTICRLRIRIANWERGHDG